MPFQNADALSLGFFVLILIWNTGFFLFALRKSHRGLDSLESLKSTRRTQAGFAVWILACSFFVLSGLTDKQPFPFVPVFFLIANLPAVFFALSKAGRRWSQALPLSLLVGSQIFRLPLELVLHRWAELGTIPETMTWTGRNWDILSGIAALIATPLAARSRAAVWGANIVGSVLLLNVMRVAILSSPLPFAWGVQPPLLLAMQSPYYLIAPLCVGFALAGQLLLTRRLLGR